MRAKLALAALVAGAATTMAPAPASAVCSIPLYTLTGHCDVCSILRIDWLACVQ